MIRVILVVATENLIQTGLNGKCNVLAHLTEKAQGRFQAKFDEGSHPVIP